MTGVCSALTIHWLQVIHDEGVIHNDLKPENFVCIGPALRLIDFGIANKIELDHTSIERDICCGTVNYMAPETIDTHEDHDYYKVPQLFNWEGGEELLVQECCLYDCKNINLSNN